MGDHWFHHGWCSACDECTLKCGNDFKTGNLLLLHDAPFAKGFTKAAWLGTWHGQEVVVKMPKSRAVAERFVHFHIAGERSSKLLPARYTYRVYGGCFDPRESPFEVTESLVRLDDVLATSTLPWCFRVHLAWQITRLGAFMEDRNLTHCDWQRVQASVEPASGQLKLIDVKSIVTGSTRLVGWSRKGVLNHDLRSICQHQYKYTKDMAQSTASEFLPPLLLRHGDALWRTVPGRAGVDDLQIGLARIRMVHGLLAGLGHTDRSQHWTFAQAASHLETFIKSTGALACVLASRKKNEAMLREAAVIKEDRIAECRKSDYCR